MVQEVERAALASEMAKRIAAQKSQVLSVDELAARVVSKHREHLTATLANRLIAELGGPIRGETWCCCN